MKKRTPTQAQLDALKPTQWKKGQSGNPLGKPKQVITPLLLKALKSKKIGKMVFPDGRNLQDVILESIVKSVIDGNPSVIRELWDRFDGKQMAESSLMNENNPVGMAIKNALINMGNTAASKNDGSDS